jgi:hypothetical protein
MEEKTAPFTQTRAHLVPQLSLFYLGGLLSLRARGLNSQLFTFTKARQILSAGYDQRGDSWQTRG